MVAVFSNQRRPFWVDLSRGNLGYPYGVVWSAADDDPCNVVVWQFHSHLERTYIYIYIYLNWMFFGYCI